MYAVDYVFRLTRRGIVTAIVTDASVNVLILELIYKFVLLSRAGLKAEQHCREVGLHAEDPRLRLGEDRRHHIHDDALRRHPILSGTGGESDFFSAAVLLRRRFFFARDFSFYALLSR